MSSGQKRLVFNSRERGISADHNRLQSFAAAYLVDALHALFDPRAGNVSLGNGATELTGTAGPIGTPLQGAVLDGLMVVAPLGSALLSVTPGVVLLVDISGLTGSPVTTPHDADDSPAKLIVDSVGTSVLAFPGNASGSTRVDVVEVRRNPNVIVETQSADIYDNATGQFTPASVTRVRTERLEYRIRTGTPGAGLPAAVQGWLPLAVISVPNGAANFDACAIYDVRPLIRDRSNMLTAASHNLPPAASDLHTDCRTAAGQRRLFGVCDLQFGGYRAGGQLRWEYSGAQQDWIDLQAAQFLEPGFVSAANQLLYLWLAFPGGLPRWVRYTPGNVAPFGGRVPSGMYGVPVISTTPPAGASGQSPNVALSLPTGSGLTGASTTNAVCLLAFAADDANNRALVSVRDRRTHFVFDSTLGLSGAPIITLTPASTTFGEDRYELVFGQHIPKNARRVLVRAKARFSATAGTAFNYLSVFVVLDPLATGWDQEILGPWADGNFPFVMPAGGTHIAEVAAWVDLPPLVPTLSAYSAVTRHRIRMTWAVGAATKDAGQSSLTVLGWEI